jgi:tRNA (guanine-N7-)-methyltransferase
MRNANRRIVLRTRPEGIAGPEHFAEETVAVRAPGPGEVLPISTDRPSTKYETKARHAGSPVTELLWVKRP